MAVYYYFEGTALGILVDGSFGDVFTCNTDNYRDSYYVVWAPRLPASDVPSSDFK